MNNFIAVFSVIKGNCDKAGIPGEECFTSLNKLVEDKQLSLPLYLHLEVLRGLGLIKFNPRAKGLFLTEKGGRTDPHSVVGTRVLVLSTLYLCRYLLLLVLFWPVLLLVPKQPVDEMKRNSAG